MSIAYLLSGLTEGQVFAPETAMDSANLIQELVEAQAQRPEPQDALGRTDLVVVAAHEFLEVREEDFDRPALGDMADDLFQRVLHSAGGPVVALVERIVWVQFGNEDLARAHAARQMC